MHCWAELSALCDTYYSQLYVSYVSRRWILYTSFCYVIDAKRVPLCVLLCKCLFHLIPFSVPTLACSGTRFPNWCLSTANLTTRQVSRAARNNADWIGLAYCAIFWDILPHYNLACLQNGLARLLDNIYEPFPLYLLHLVPQKHLQPGTCHAGVVFRSGVISSGIASYDAGFVRRRALLCVTRLF